MTHTSWTDDNYLFLLQIYLKKPAGVKPMYARRMIELSLELHIPPRELHRRMKQLESRAEANIEALWQRYAQHATRLKKDIERLRAMRGFNHAEAFYEGVVTKPTFETDFLPLDNNPAMTPMMLIIILDLYFRLVPITMVAETPEVVELGKLMSLSPSAIVEVMCLFQVCDPYLYRSDMLHHPLLPACRQVWQRYGMANTETLAELATAMKAYFVS